MRRKLLAALVVVSALSLGACTEDATMDELIEDIELNQTTDPDDDDDGGSPGG
jgi:predicted small secreted protein